jgi:hypothetical protein
VKTVGLPMPGGECRQHNCASSVTNSSVLDAARNLSRDLGAEHLLLVGESLDSYSSHTFLSFLDLTIVGGVLLPGRQVHMSGKAAGALFDVETGRIVFLSSAELEKSGLTPTFYVEDKNNVLREKLREDLREKLAQDVLNQLQHSISANR